MKLWEFKGTERTFWLANIGALYFISADDVRRLEVMGQGATPIDRLVYLH